MDIILVERLNRKDVKRINQNEFSLCEVSVIYFEAILCGNTLENMDHVYFDLIDLVQYETHHNCFTFGNFLYWPFCSSSSIC